MLFLEVIHFQNKLNKKKSVFWILSWVVSLSKKKSVFELFSQYVVLCMLEISLWVLALTTLREVILKYLFSCILHFVYKWQQVFTNDKEFCSVYECQWDISVYHSVVSLSVSTSILQRSSHQTYLSINSNLVY